MNKLETPPTSNSSPHTHAGVKRTPVIHTHVVQGLDSTNKRNTPTRVHMYTPKRVYIHTCICIYIHRHTYIHIHTYAHAHMHAYMHMNIHVHVHAHLYTNIKSQQRRLNASNNIIDAHTHPYTYACIYTCICIYTYVHTLQRMRRRCVRWCQRNICMTHTTAHALVLKTPVPKCTQHSLQKECTYIYTYTHMHTHTYAQEYTCASITPSKQAEEQLLRLTIYAQVCIHIHIHMYIHACVYLYIYTCIYIHIYMPVHIHTCTYIHTHVQHVHMHACSTSASTVRQRLRGKPAVSWRPSPCPLQSGGGSPFVASNPIARPRGTTDKRRSNTIDNSSSHHHDSAPPRLQPLICTGAEPIHPIHGPPIWFKLLLLLETVV